MIKDNFKNKKTNAFKQINLNNKRKNVKLSDEKLKKINGGVESLLDDGLVCPHCRVELVEEEKRKYICPICKFEYMRPGIDIEVDPPSHKDPHYTYPQL